MRTKHLLYTAAIAAMFSACTNDDFMLDTPQSNVANDGRPTVSDVRLNFIGDDAETRLVFEGGDKGYAWEANDTIGALLMDNVNRTSGTWLQKYSLISNIHTSYPFTYSTEDKAWGCNTKMLEGNYFFAYPWSSYNGNRKVTYTLIDQQQAGVKSNVVAQSYADNQFFIGYSQIMAGTDAKDVLNSDVTMYPILGAIQLRIVNTGTQTYHINKIVLSGGELSSEITFDPTNAAYGEGYKWNLKDSKTFNYANYTGNKVDTYDSNPDNVVYNIKDGDDYSQAAAIRSVVNYDGTEKSAQLTISGTDEERALVSTKDNPNAIAYALIMANPQVLDVDGDGTAETTLSMSIYTDEGIVQNIELTKINESTGENYVAITDSKVAAIGPDVKNTIRVQIDDNSFLVPQTMDIYNTDDLLQFIKWNANVAGTRNITATLQENVKLTKEMYDILTAKAHENVSLTIKPSDNEVLTLAEDLPANVLELSRLDINADVVAECDLTLTSETQELESLTSYGKLTINDAKAVIPAAIYNNGTLEVGANATIANTIEITNNGEMVVAKGADVKAAVTNNALLTDNGYMDNVTTNATEATITMGEGGILKVKTNNGEIISAKDSQVTVETNSGSIKVVTGAVVTAKGGIIYREISGKASVEATTSPVNTWVVVDDVEFAANTTADYNIPSLIVAKEATVEVANGETLTVTNLTIAANATTKGAIAATNVVVNKGVTLSNSGAITADAFTNNGSVYNSGSVNLPYGSKVEGNGEWKYNDWTAPETDPDAISAKQKAMNEAVEVWAGNWSNCDDSDNHKYYGYTPYNITTFIASMNVWLDGNGDYKDAADELAKQYGLGEGTDFTTVLYPNKVAVPEFEIAVNEILTNANFTALKKVILNEAGGLKNVTLTADAKVYENQTAAYDAFKTYVANPTNITDIDDHIIAATVWKFTNSEIATLLSKSDDKVPYTYIWKDCDLYKLMNVWKVYSGKLGSVGDGNEYTDATGSQASNYANAEKLVTWVNAVLSSTSTGTPNLADAQAAIKALNINATNIDQFKNYNNAQTKAIKEELDK